MIADFTDKREVIREFREFCRKMASKAKLEDRQAWAYRADLFVSMDEDYLRFSPIAAQIAQDEDAELALVINTKKSKARVAARQQAHA